MTIDDIKQIVVKNKGNYAIQLKRHNRPLFDEINTKYNFNTFGENLYNFIYGDAVGKCEVCGAKCKFDGIHKGYRKRCSYKCMGRSKYNNKHEIRSCVICDKQFEVYRHRKKTTCSAECLLKLNASDEVNKKRMDSLKNTLLEKYGVNHPSKMSGFGGKLKETKLKNHGDKNYTNSKKAKATKLKKYGNENYANIEKARQTKMIKYGDANYNNRKKFVATNVELYGVKYPIQSDVFKEKQKSTFIEKHGGIGLQSDNIKEKVYLTNIERYGNNIATKNDTIKNKIKQTWYNAMFDILLDTERLENKVKPLFNKEEYNGSKENYNFLCLKCNKEFVGSIKDGKIPRCLDCYPIQYYKSKSEAEIFNFLLSLGVLESDIVCNDRKILNGLELDIYIPKFKLAIEFDGIIWHSEFIGNKSPDYHLIKTEVCNRKGIKLLHIFENEWIKKQDIVKSKIKYALNNNTKTIFARKCIIEETPLSIKNAFLNKYHIQGDDKSQIAVGAYFDNVLVAVMTFGNKRIALGSKSSNKDEYEMYRFCTGDASVIGIGGKLLSYFIKTYNPKKIISYADRRWSGKNSFYEKIQFKLDSITRPNYWYFNLKDPYVLYHRFGFRKSELIKKLERYDPNLTEWQNMQLNGYDRIWDCGNFKYEWTSNFIEN